MKKTILITGAGSGIGKDTAIALARKGHHVIATTETEAQSIALQNEIQSLNLEMVIYKLDITIAEDRHKIENHDLDVLINNAGIGESGSLAEIDINKLRRNFEVNVFSAFELSQLALKKCSSNNKAQLFLSVHWQDVLPCHF